MNESNTILLQRWRDAPYLPATGKGKGWNVVFARASDGTLPVLDYIGGKDKDSDPEFEFTDDHFKRLMGLIEHVRMNGVNELPQLDVFVGNDAKNSMCEFRLKNEGGHRILCFKRLEQTLVLASAFRKPFKMTTPPEAKTRAEAVLAQHEQHSKKQRK